MSKPKLKPCLKPEIFYDREVNMWVVIDGETHVYTQAETIFGLIECYVDALRGVCIVLGKKYDEATGVSGESPNRRPRRKA